MQVVIERAPALTDPDAVAVRKLAAIVTTSDAVAPLSEQTLLQLHDPQAVHLLVRSEGRALIGYAQLKSDASGELMVDPAHRRRGLGRWLAETLEAQPEASDLRVWAHGDGAGAQALASRMGYARTRVLLQLRRELSSPLPEPVWAPGVTVRAFRPGVDEQAWLAVNGAAFATHPEQGRWTLADLQQREAQSWFDPEGFFLAERDGEVLGFHWTKIHQDGAPPIGEVYVVGVRPQDGGLGLGRALTLAGLHHLRSRGLEQVLLYVDESNTPAMKTYERLGFTRWATDVMYSRPD